MFARAHRPLAVRCVDVGGVQQAFQMDIVPSLLDAERKFANYIANYFSTMDDGIGTACRSFEQMIDHSDP